MAFREKDGARAGSGATWRAKDPVRRPSCALLIGFGLALLRAADAPLLATLLTIRCARTDGIASRALLPCQLLCRSGPADDLLVCKLQDEGKAFAMPPAVPLMQVSTVNPRTADATDASLWTCCDEMRA